MENERRKHNRNKLDQLMELFDVSTDSRLGTLVNISLDGIMVLSPSPVPLNKVWQLKVALPSETKDGKTLILGVESLWCDSAPNVDLYWSGFQIIDISDEDLEWISKVAF